MDGGFYSCETPDGCEAELVNGVLAAVLGRKFTSMLALEEELVRLTGNRFVRVAVETAAWEFVAQRRHVNLRQLFEIPDRPARSGVAIGLYSSVAELLDAIRRYDPYQYGHLKLKIKPGHDIEIVRAARNLVGTFPLFVDANAGYSPSDLATFTALIFSNPLSTAEHNGLRRLLFHPAMKAGVMGWPRKQ